MSDHLKYRIYLDDELLAATDWLPAAQAAWDRVTRDRDGAQHSGDAALCVDGRVVKSVTPKTGVGHPWPIDDDHVTDLRDLAKAITALTRAAGVEKQTLLDSLNERGLPTTSARLKRISTLEQGLRATTSPAELVVLCYAAIGCLKARSNAS